MKVLIEASHHCDRKRAFSVQHLGYFAPPPQEFGQVGRFEPHLLHAEFDSSQIIRLKPQLFKKLGCGIPLNARSFKIPVV